MIQVLVTRSIIDFVRVSVKGDVAITVVIGNLADA